MNCISELMRHIVLNWRGGEWSRLIVLVTIFTIIGMYILVSITAEPSFRRQGIGLEAAQLMIAYGKPLSSGCTHTQ